MMDDGTSRATMDVNWEPWDIEFLWLSDGSLLVSGRGSASGLPVPVFTLAHRLFVWHRRTWYGTTCEYRAEDGRYGLAINAADAVSWLADVESHAVSIANIHWPSDIKQYRDAANLLRRALQDGNIVPDFQAWRDGKLRWRFHLPQGARVSPFTTEWLNHVMVALERTSPEYREALTTLQTEHPLLASAAALERELQAEGSQQVRAGEWWIDETDWRTAIGWQADTVPFHTGLQLVEPTGDGAGNWTLCVVLVDQADSTNVYAHPDDRGGTFGACPSPWRAHLSRVDRDVRRIALMVPWFADDQSCGLTGTVLRRDLPEEDAWVFLEDISPALLEAGIPVFLPNWWDEVRRLKARLQAKVKSSVGSQSDPLLGLSQVVQFDWQIAVGDHEITPAQFEELVRQKRKFLRVSGKWIPLDAAFLAVAREAMRGVEKRHGLTMRDVLEMHLLGDVRQTEVGGDIALTEEGRHDVEVVLNEHLNQWVSELQQADGMPALETPTNFRGTLRPYQQKGYSWLVHLRNRGLGAILADDMGLGKTVQYIAYLQQVKMSPALLICPTSVIGNWQKELERFAPDLRVHVHYGPERHRGDLYRQTASGVDLVITSYTLAHLDGPDLQSVEWTSVCLDEAQNIKNAHTKQSTSIRKLSAQHRVAMTGTPMENRLTELWSLVDFVNPGYLGSLSRFTQRFVTPIERDGNREYVTLVRKLVQPFLLRRSKQDPAVELDLPQKAENKVYVPLTPEQAALYEGTIERLFERLDELEGLERRGLILATLTRLKQVCDYPGVLSSDARKNGQATRPASRRAKSGVLSRSGKLDRLLDMVQELRSEGDRCLIFTQFVGAGQLICDTLSGMLDEPVLFLHGGTRKQDRDQMIERFQSSTSPEGVFVLSLKAGGVGLNLTTATHVFHFDRWWNPAVENQATDRAYRIGQTRRVQVHKFVTLGTLEERIDEMLERKQALADEIIGASEQWITELSTSELRELFTLRREWVSD